MELILIRERSFTTLRSGTNITTFGEEEEFGIASKSSSELRIRGGPWLKPWQHVDVARLGVLRARKGGGAPELARAVRRGGGAGHARSCKQFLYHVSTLKRAYYSIGHNTALHSLYVLFCCFGQSLITPGCAYVAQKML